MVLQDFEITLSPLEPKLSKSKFVGNGRPKDEKLCYRFDFSWTGSIDGSEDTWGIKSKGCLLFINREGELDWSLAKIVTGFRSYEVHIPTPGLKKAVLRAIQADRAGQIAAEKLFAHEAARSIANGKDPQFVIDEADFIKVGA